uniref:Uncharacterized protein n=1 Tax=viral metagenome TaxID=1070528 RepID=A0A6C0KSW2_9ZZZZ
MVASVVAGLGMIPVMLLFGSITAAIIILTTPEKVVIKKQEDHEPAHEKHPEKPHTMPHTVKVDPSGYLAPTKEHFVNGGSAMGSIQPVSDPIGYQEVDAAPYSGAALPEQTPPTSRNLFMNILVDEMKYNPNRPAAASVSDPTVKQTMDDYFRIQWFSDPTDVFGKNQNQRQYVTQPSTTVPNDQGSFADWLYKIPGKTCKEGGRAACLAGTDGATMPWLNQFS